MAEPDHPPAALMPRSHPSGALQCRTMSDEKLTFTAFQDHIRERYFATDQARGTPATFLWLIEEIGELATALHGDDKANLEEEFADVIAWLTTLANINDVDLEKALREKYLTGPGPAGHK
jgi:NTP pyrophosphatase (non-canonical NTP hydrolase)